MTALVTLNATVAQLEDALRSGAAVPDVAREFAEPPANVYAVYRDLVARGVIEDGKTPGRPAKAAAPVPAARPLTSVPPAQPSAGSAPSVDALVNAAARSTSKRTQVLGTKLHDLAAVIRSRLSDEKAAAEQAERVKAERDAAAAEVERLERQLREAKAKLRPSRQGGDPLCSVRRSRAGPSSTRSWPAARVVAGRHRPHRAAPRTNVTAQVRHESAPAVSAVFPRRRRLRVPLRRDPHRRRTFHHPTSSPPCAPPLLRPADALPRRRPATGDHDHMTSARLLSTPADGHGLVDRITDPLYHALATDQPAKPLVAVVVLDPVEQGGRKTAKGKHRVVRFEVTHLEPVHDVNQANELRYFIQSLYEARTSTGQQRPLFTLGRDDENRLGVMEKLEDWATEEGHTAADLEQLWREHFGIGSDAEWNEGSVPGDYRKASLAHLLSFGYESGALSLDAPLPSDERDEDEDDGDDSGPSDEGEEADTVNDQPVEEVVS